MLTVKLEIIHSPKFMTALRHLTIETEYVKL